MRWPGHTNFTELNLRFYVRQGARRGVCFIREIVPQRLTASLARLLYNEPYVAAPLKSVRQAQATEFTHSYELTWRRQTYRLGVHVADRPYRPADESVEHFFKEHEWGFGRTRSQRLLTYRVAHPVWDVYPVERHELSFDFGAVYGEAWNFLNARTPNSLAFAKGSDVQVFGAAS